MIRTSFQHQSEAQPPNFPARRTGQPQYPIYLLAGKVSYHLGNAAFSGLGMLAQGRASDF
jgi:hypothetical protein